MLLFGTYSFDKLISSKSMLLDKQTSQTQIITIDIKVTYHTTLTGRQGWDMELQTYHAYFYLINSWTRYNSAKSLGKKSLAKLKTNWLYTIRVMYYKNKVWINSPWNQSRHKAHSSIKPIAGRLQWQYFVSSLLLSLLQIFFARNSLKSSFSKISAVCKIKIRWNIK